MSPSEWLLALAMAVVLAATVRWYVRSGHWDDDREARDPREWWPMTTEDEPLYPECPNCGEAILPWDRRISTNGGALLFHRECLLRSVVGSVGHQLGRCSCFGGSEEDPPGMTAREAARAAVELFESRMEG